MSEVKRILWKGKDFPLKSAQIERRKLGVGWELAQSPYPDSKDRYIVFRYVVRELIV
jgi:hypothetical protein